MSQHIVTFLHLTVYILIQYSAGFEMYFLCKNVQNKLSIIIVIYNFLSKVFIISLDLSWNL